MKMNKGDVILICILLATIAFFAINEFNIMNNLPQFESSFTTLFAVIFGGELLSFAIYKIGTAKYEGQKEIGLAKYIPFKNSETIKKIEEDVEKLKPQGEHAKHE